VDVVKSRYVATMAGEIERTEASLRAAVDGATRLLTMTEAQRRQRELVRDGLRTLVVEIADFVTAELDECPVVHPHGIPGSPNIRLPVNGR